MLPKRKDLVYIISHNEYEPIVTQWITLYVNAQNATYFDSFGVEHIPKKLEKPLGKKNISRNIYRIEAYDSIVCRYFCIKFIDFMLTERKKFIRVYKFTFS